MFSKPGTGEEARWGLLDVENGALLDAYVPCCVATALMANRRQISAHHRPQIMPQLIDNRHFSRPASVRRLWIMSQAYRRVADGKNQVNARRIP